MKQLIYLALLSILLTAQGQTETLTLASDVWPPFTNTPGEKSFALDLVAEALKRMDVSSDFVIVDFDEVLSGIDQGNYSGSAALWETAERRKKYYFSEPYLQNQLILVGKKGSDVSAGSIAELTGKRIGIVGDYAYGTDISNARNIVPVQGESDQQNLERLLSGQIDYMLVDALLIQYLLKFQVNDVSEFLEIASGPVIVRSLHFALSKDVNDAASLIKRFNEEIGKMIADGTYHRILELNWIKADVDGDGRMEMILAGDAAGKEAPASPYEVFTDTTDISSSETTRYYINGVLYDNWDEVPPHYKEKELKGSVYDANTAPRDYGLRLQF